MPGILVVEDDENLNRGITFSLKKSGYEVFSAESMKKAKRIARVVPVPIGTPQCCLWMAVKDTLFAAAVCKEKFTGTASCRRADHGKSCRHFRIGQQRLPQQPHSPSGEPSESPRHFAASMDESVIVGYYTLKKCLSAAPRCLQILRKGQKIYGKK